MISLIVAYDANGVIGNGPDIPWHLPADFAYFKNTTMGHPVIMGRTTFESIGKPLPGRMNILVTRDTAYQAEGVHVVHTPEKAIEIAEKEHTGEVFILGGSQIYSYVLENNLVNKAYITHIDANVEGDVFFPKEKITSWLKTQSTLRESDEKNNYDMEFAVYEKNVVVDGKELSRKLEEKLRERVELLDEKPSLGIYVVGDNSATLMYVKKKRELADRIGVNFYEFIFESDISQQELISHITKHQENVDGIVVQLPLPKHIDTEKVCAAIPTNKDPDLLNKQTIDAFHDGDMSLLPPVVNAIDEIITQYSLDVVDKSVLVIGKGKLVGGPAISYFTHKGGKVTSVEKENGDFSAISKEADIIVSGAGVSDLVTPEMIKDRAILFDGGTSGSSGSLRGDIAWGCVKKATLFSRSPGGIGPLTVVSLFKNFLTLVEKK